MQQQPFLKVKRYCTSSRGLILLTTVVVVLIFLHTAQLKNELLLDKNTTTTTTSSSATTTTTTTDENSISPLKQLEEENQLLKLQIRRLTNEKLTAAEKLVKDPTRRSLASHEMQEDHDGGDDFVSPHFSSSSSSSSSTTTTSENETQLLLAKVLQQNQMLQEQLTQLQKSNNNNNNNSKNNSNNNNHQKIENHDASKKHSFDMDDEEAGTYSREVPLNDIEANLRSYYSSYEADGADGKVVLMTGAAGFVGFHTSIHMQNRGDFIIGLDNLNAYYDPKLKTARLEVLKEKGVKVLKGDVCDTELLRVIFRTIPITHVVHLAAQAGVRFALDHPLAYIRANVKCFVTLLEVIKEFHTAQKPIKTVYASSSSVYGLNEKQPFNERDQVDRQASLYGATKKADEEIAHVYHHVHKLPLTGLRFFTVYGPFGRPDMAYYSFTQAILAGKNITIYQNDDGSEMMRDFTYVSDIVAGITASVDLGAELEVFNLGNNSPEKLSKLIHLVETGLGKVAGKIYSPIIAGDVPVTFADVSHAKEKLGYTPKVSLQDGLSKFLTWYAEFFKVNIPGLPPTSEKII